jgi:hypothetical protein
LGVATPRQYGLLKRKLTIGSGSENDIVLAEPTVSRHHALLKRRFGRFQLVDLESTNGTFVNERRIGKPTAIARGDELRLGGARFVFLESPGTRELRKRVPLSTKLALLLVVCALSFAVTQHLINRSLSQKSDARPISLPTSRASAPTEPKKEMPLAAVPHWPSAKPFAARPVRSATTPPIVFPDWLGDLNHWRGMAGVAPVREDPDAVAGATAHCRYVVKNFLIGNPLTPHYEDPSNPWYTPEGEKAALEGDHYGPGRGPLMSATSVIDGLVHGPFHRLGLVYRDLKAGAYAHYCESGVCAEVLVLESRLKDDPGPTWFGKFPDPLMFPSDGMTLPAKYRKLDSGEWPEPLSCAGYKRPAGSPITLQFDARFVPKLLSFTLSCNGRAAQVCGYDSTDYANTDEGTQAWGRGVLKSYGGAVLIPRDPLKPGATCTVSVTAQAQRNPFNWPSPSSFAGQIRTYTWSFSVAPEV